MRAMFPGVAYESTTPIHSLIKEDSPHLPHPSPVTPRSRHPDCPDEQRSMWPSNGAPVTEGLDMVRGGCASGLFGASHLFASHGLLPHLRSLQLPKASCVLMLKIL